MILLINIKNNKRFIIPMSKTNTNLTIKKDAVENPLFISLKERLKDGQYNTNIPWDRVFNLDRKSFLPDHKKILNEAEDVLKEIEKRDYGQQLFREIISNESRIAPVTITAGSALFFSPALYHASEDTLLYSVDLTERLQKLSKNQQSKYIEITSSQGLDIPEVFLLHEMDHAARLYGAKTPSVLNEHGGIDKDGIISYNIAIGCFEKHAMHRANHFRSEINLSPRTDYGKIDEQMNLVVQEMNNSSKLEKMQQDGIPENLINKTLGMITMMEAKNSGCDNVPTVEEIKQRADTRIEHFLNETGITKVKPLQDLPLPFESENMLENAPPNNTPKPQKHTPKTQI